MDDKQQQYATIKAEALKQRTTKSINWSLLHCKTGKKISACIKRSSKNRIYGKPLEVRDFL
jgi:HD superfamily phosphohydrolase YqeK